MSKSSDHPSVLQTRRSQRKIGKTNNTKTLYDTTPLDENPTASAANSDLEHFSPEHDMSKSPHHCNEIIIALSEDEDRADISSNGAMTPSMDEGGESSDEPSALSPHADAFIPAACKSKSLATTRRTRSVSRYRHPPYSQSPTSSLHASRHRKTSKSKTDCMALAKDDPMALLALAIQQTLNRVDKLGDETRIHRESSSLYQRERDCLTSLKPYRDGESIVH